MGETGSGREREREKTAFCYSAGSQQSNEWSNEKKSQLENE